MSADPLDPPPRSTTSFLFLLQWLGDVNQKVLLENGEPVPVVVLANKVQIASALTYTQ